MIFARQRKSSVNMWTSDSPKLFGSPGSRPSVSLRARGPWPFHGNAAMGRFEREEEKRRNAERRERNRARGLREGRNSRRRRGAVLDEVEFSCRSGGGGLLGGLQAGGIQCAPNGVARESRSWAEVRNGVVGPGGPGARTTSDRGTRPCFRVQVRGTRCATPLPWIR